MVYSFVDHDASVASLASTEYLTSYSRFRGLSASLSLTPFSGRQSRERSIYSSSLKSSTTAVRYTADRRVNWVYSCTEVPRTQ